MHGEPSSSEEGLISAARNYIELNITDQELSPADISVAVSISERQLSRIFFVSPRHFRRAFRDYFEITPLQWRREAQRQRLRD